MRPTKRRTGQAPKMPRTQYRASYAKLGSARTGQMMRYNAPAMPRKRVQSNRRHWHVIVMRGGIWTFAGVRMTQREREGESDAGRRRVVRRWFTSASAARKLKDKLSDDGAMVMTFECQNPDGCDHRPPS